MNGPHFKNLIVVLTISLLVFAAAKPIALRFSNETDFSRRRNVWLILTATAFLSPTFWAFLVVACPLIVWAGRKDTNIVALYLLLLHVVPEVAVSIPMIGAHGLFDLNNYRLLSFCLLFPKAWQIKKAKSPTNGDGLDAMDVMLLAYGLLQTILFIPPDLPNHIILHDSFTNQLRRGFQFFIDVYLVYFVVSRACRTKRQIIDAIAAYCLACILLSLIGSFEFSWHWLLYVDAFDRWADSHEAGFYLLRGDALRAQASAGHPLALGYLIAVGFGFWLYLGEHVQSKLARSVVALVLWLGLLAAYSRGPWLGAIVIFFAFVAGGRNAASRLLKAATIIAILGCIVAMTPAGKRIAAVLPIFGGTVDSGSTEYRHRLAERSWDLLQSHFFFGDQMAVWKMEDLRQGQGIIDLVNTYAEVALFYGFVGLSLFTGFILMGLIKVSLLARSRIIAEPDFASLGLALAACIIGTLLMIGSCSFIFGYEKMFYVLAGFASAYSRIWSIKPVPPDGNHTPMQVN